MRVLTKLIWDEDAWKLQQLEASDQLQKDVTRMGQLVNGSWQSGDKLVIDLTTVETIDSRGLRFLLDIQTKLSTSQVEVILQNPNNRLERLLNIMQFQRAFRIHKSENL